MPRSTSAIKKTIVAEMAASVEQPGDSDVFRAIFENAAIGIYQSTPEGRYLRANQALADMLERFE
jgi:PAS domain-containing protein